MSRRLQQRNGFLPWFLYPPGPPNHTLSADTMKWQYHQVMNIETGLNMVSSFFQPFSRHQRSLTQDPETELLNATES